MKKATKVSILVAGALALSAAATGCDAMPAVTSNFTSGYTQLGGGQSNHSECGGVVKVQKGASGDITTWWQGEVTPYGYNGEQYAGARCAPWSVKVVSATCSYGGYDASCSYDFSRLESVRVTITLAGTSTTLTYTSGFRYVYL